MPGPLAAARLLLPTQWRLRHQMLWLLAGITTLAMLLLMQISSLRLSGVAADSARHWAEAVARTAASAAAERISP